MSGKINLPIVLAVSVVAAAILFTAVFLLIGGGRNDNSAWQREDYRGVWIASVHNIDFPSAPGLNKDELKAEIDEIIENTEAAGLNTVCFQVRPSADAMYESQLFPVSKFISTDGSLPLDCLDYIITAAHAKDISVFAWINPLRVTASSYKNSDAAISSLPAGSPATKDNTVMYDGKLYFDAGQPMVRSLIAEGVAEIVTNYDVDGIIFDDYFYPYPSSDSSMVFNDSRSYSEYAEDGMSLEDWRRENVNSIIRNVYAAVKSIDKDCLFGVSPFGIWKNGSGSEDGSATNGLESYSAIYCDTVAWIKGGYIDFIAPQLYWQFNSGAAPYGALCDWWDSAVAKTDVKLMISHGVYRYEEGEWDNPTSEMLRQIQYASEKKSYRGSLYYGYDEIKTNARGVADEIAQAYAEK